MAPLTRKALVSQARFKKRDALFLLENGRWATAYYLYGLCVEIAIKAIVAKNLAARTVPEKGFESTFYSHRLDSLIVLAGLKADRDQKLGNPQFKANWELVSDWRVESRYENIGEALARAMSNAVDDGNSGVFQWLMKHW